MQAHLPSIPAARIPLLTAPIAGLFSVSSCTPAPQVEPGPHVSSLPIESVAEAAGLAHDAGNLLGALGLYSELLGAPGVLRPEHRHYATELGLIATRSAALIGRLLHPPPVSGDVQEAPSAGGVVRVPVERGGQWIAETVHTTQALTLQALAPVLERIAAGSARVVVRETAVLPTVALRAEVLERITVNLVRNAAQAIRKHAPTGGGEIRVTLSVVAEQLELKVEDNGHGMSPQMMAKFLQPESLSASMTRGLGHHIVHELMTASGGRMTIRARPAEGTAICLRWPIAEMQRPLTRTSSVCRKGSSGTDVSSKSEWSLTLPMEYNHLSQTDATGQRGLGEC